VLHTLPAGLLASREPLQIGAELYGHAGPEADSEIIRLLARALDLAAIAPTRIDLGHVGIFRALMAEAGLAGDAEQELFAALQAKDVPTLAALVATVPEPARSALLALPDCYGGSEALDDATRRLPATPEISVALATLRRLALDLEDLPNMSVGFDLADLRGYHYHSGVVFAAYCQGSPGAVALGGRYDKVGESFGRGRPATGFSMDLRDLARLGSRPDMPRAILAPWPEDTDLHEEIERLRGRGETVVLALPGHDGDWREAGCDRLLSRRGTEWTIEPLKED
jgi:ATP phosphoribosyltransferase regulatory subunit